jgi:hypothetical protein
MTSSMAPISGVQAVRTLRVCIYANDRRHVFDLGPRDLRAIVIGNVADADVRIEGEDVPEIACHLEREGDAILLVPAYADDLRVGGVPVTTVCVMPWFSTIDFSSERVTIAVSERKPALGHAAAISGTRERVRLAGGDGGVADSGL